MIYLPDIGGWLRAKSLKRARQNGSVRAARNRLATIIAADRCAAPCWQWVRQRSASQKYEDALRSWEMQNAWRPYGCKREKPAFPRDFRPRYRYQERR